jgi:hypothetical protein
VNQTILAGLVQGRYSVNDLDAAYGACGGERLNIQEGLHRLLPEPDINAIAVENMSTDQSADPVGCLEVRHADSTCVDLWSAGARLAILQPVSIDP